MSHILGPDYERGLSALPEDLRESIGRYVDHGIPPGHFLTAVIENDLKEAVGRCSDPTLRTLKAAVVFFYNYAPSQCWGSRDKRLAWRGLEKAA